MPRNQKRTAQVLRKVANPTPPILLIANPAKEQTMPRAKAKPRTRAKANPVHRQTRKRATRRNPTMHLSTTRKRATRRNPLIIYKRKPNSAASSSEVLDFSIAGLLLGVAQPILSPIIGRFLPARFASPASAAAAGYGLSLLFQMFPLTRRFAKPARLLGFSTAIIALAAPIVRQWLAPSSTGAAANGMSGARRRYGMNGIGVMPSIPPGMDMPAPPMKAAGMNGIGVYSVPGQFSRR